MEDVHDESRMRLDDEGALQTLSPRVELVVHPLEPMVALNPILSTKPSTSTAATTTSTSTHVHFFLSSCC